MASNLISDKSVVGAPSDSAEQVVTRHRTDESCRATLTPRQRLITALFFIAGAAIHVLRVWPRLRNPGIWAEDAAIFYLQDQTRGLGALFSEYAGYLHLICRIPAAVVGPAGLPAVPAAFAWMGTVIGILCFAVVLSPRLDHLIPSVYGRGFAYLAICCLPAMDESGANVLNLIFVGGIALLLLGLAQAPITRVGRALELMAITILGLSGPLIVFLSPLYLWRWFTQRRVYNLVICLVVAATAATQLIVYLNSTRQGGQVGTLRNGARFYLQRVIGEWLVGPTAASNSWDDFGYIIPLAVAWFAVVATAAVWFLRVRAVLVMATTAAMACAAALTYGWALQYPWAGDRHLVVPMAAIIVLAVAATARSIRDFREHTGSRRVVDATLGGLVALALVGAVGGIQSHFRVDRYDYLTPASDLEAFQACVDRGDESCQILISPYPYVLNFKWK